MRRCTQWLPMRRQSSQPLLLGATSATWSRWVQDSLTPRSSQPLVESGSCATSACLRGDVGNEVEHDDRDLRRRSRPSSSVEAELTKSFSSVADTAQHHPQYASEITARGARANLAG